MKVKPMLDNWELKGLQKIISMENRVLVEHKIPGLQGSLFQDIGDSPIQITLIGSLQGDEVKTGFLEEIRSKFRAGKPIPFTADITTATDLKEVIIQEVSFTELSTEPDTINYTIILKEFTPSAEDKYLALSQVEEDINKEADSQFQSILEDLEAASAIREQIEDLAEELGLSLPALGYKSIQEVLNDLVDSVDEMLKKSPDEWAETIGEAFGEIMAKILVTMLTGDKEIWGGLSRIFEEGLAELLG